MRAYLIPLALALPALILGCEAGPGGTEMGDADPGAEVAPPAEAPATDADIGEIRNSWQQAAAAGNLDSVAALYAEDAVFVDASGETIEGRSAIQEMLTEGFQGVTSVEISSTESVLGTDLASDLGTWTQTVRTPDGQEQTLNGQYLVVLRRQADGSWRIVQHLTALPQEMEQPGTMEQPDTM